MQKLTIQGNSINIVEIDGEKYISLTDLARSFGEPNVMIASWMKRKDTIEFLGIWEKLNNQNFKPHEFEGFKNDAGTNRFNLSPQQWIEKTKASGLSSKSGRYGGTYAHEDIAMHFAQWLSPEFNLYVIKEFKRLKQIEARRLSKDWQLNRALSKLNYRIHTDAVDLHLIPQKTPNKLKWPWFTAEADLLNLAIFGKTALQWRDENPLLDGNIRDYATQEQLLVLSNLENLNSQFIRDGFSKDERFRKLNEAAIIQMKSLLGSSLAKKLKNGLEEKGKADG
ncbi:MAG: KilA-N domain-containing protein [Patescibacteria group bacterium]|nr:KilA-N domain-containing protein [Patescibacteria group bacterium]